MFMTELLQIMGLHNPKLERDFLVYANIHCMQIFTYKKILKF